MGGSIARGLARGTILQAADIIVSNPSQGKLDALQAELDKAFGKGMVLTVLPMGGDALLEIAFDGVGTKRLMANTAAQHMKKL